MAPNEPHYKGHRPRLVPSDMRRVGGGFNSQNTLQDVEEAMAEVAGLYVKLENVQAQKEEAVSKAHSIEATNISARQKSQQLADALAVAHGQLKQLSSTLQATQAALAERGLSLDTAYQRVAEAEARTQANETSHRAAERAAEDARRAAKASEVRAAERDHQMEVLTAALRERTSEVERLGHEVQVRTQRELLAVSELDELRLQHRRDVEDASHRLGETERELRKTMAEEVRRSEVERQRLAAEVDACARRAQTAETETTSLREQVVGLREALRLESAEAVRTVEVARREGDLRLGELGRDLELARREASDARAEARTEAARSGRELSEARREKSELSRQLEVDFRERMATTVRELDRAREREAEAEREAERKTSELTAAAFRERALEESVRRLERENDTELTTACNVADELRAECGRERARVDEGARLLAEAEARAEAVSESLRITQERLSERDMRLHALRAEFDTQRRAALTAVDAEQRLRLGESGELKQQLTSLASRLDDERERRKDAARAAHEAETDKREAVAAEARRRLQVENAARLERTARRDLMEERELIRTMLLRAKETAGGGASPTGGASRPMQTSPDRSPVHSSARRPTEDPERADADADAAADRGESPISRRSLHISLPTPTEGASRSAHVDDESEQPSSSARPTLPADELRDDAAAADDSMSCASCASAPASTAVPAAGDKGKAEKTPGKKVKATSVTSAKSASGAERTVEKVKAKLAATPKSGTLKGKAK